MHVTCMFTNTLCSNAVQCNVMQRSEMQCRATQRNAVARKKQLHHKITARAPFVSLLGTLLGTCSRYDVVPCTSDRICESLLPKQCTKSLLHQVTPTNIFISAGCTFMHGNTVIGENECVRKEMRAAHSV